MHGVSVRLYQLHRKPKPVLRSIRFAEPLCYERARAITLRILDTVSIVKRDCTGCTHFYLTVECRQHRRIPPAVRKASPEHTPGFLA